MVAEIFVDFEPPPKKFLTTPLYFVQKEPIKVQSFETFQYSGRNS